MSLTSNAQLLDRVLARIGATAITLTDLQAAVGLGLIEAKAVDDPNALNPLIDRHLMLVEVSRFPPPEPSPQAIDQEVEAMKKRAGPNLGALMKATGLDDARLRDLARDTLRLQAYVAQRFGTSKQVGDEDVRRYYNEHQAEFTRNGRVLPLEDVETEARQRAVATRMRDTIAQWVRELRARNEVVEVR